MLNQATFKATPFFSCLSTLYCCLIRYTCIHHMYVNLYINYVLSRCRPPPALLAVLIHANRTILPQVCCLRSCLLAFFHLFYFILISLPFFEFEMEVVIFHPFFFLRVWRCCLLGFCATRSAYVSHVCIWCVRTLISLFILSKVSDLFLLICRFLFLFLFSPWGNLILILFILHSSYVGTCPVTADCIVMPMSWCGNNNIFDR